MCLFRDTSVSFLAGRFGHWAMAPCACDDEVGSNGLGGTENEARRCLDVADLMG